MIVTNFDYVRYTSGVPGELPTNVWYDIIPVLFFGEPFRNSFALHYLPFTFFSLILFFRKSLPAQLSSVLYPAVPCGAVRCCAALSFIPDTEAVPGIMRTTRYWYHVPLCNGTCKPVTYTIDINNNRNTRVRFLPRGCPSYLFFRSSFFLQITYVLSIRTWNHQQAQHSTEQHRATSGSQVILGNIKSLDAPNHGPLLPAPFPFYRILPCARARA